MLRHDDITSNHKDVAQADALQCILKEIHGCNRGQEGLAAVTTEGEEVELPCLLITDALALPVCAARIH